MLAKGWNIVKLQDSARDGDGFTDGDWIESPYITSEGIRLIQTGNVGLGKFVDRPDHRKFISETSFRELGCKWVYPGDILICRLADPIGRTCMVPIQVGPCVTAVDCTIFRPDPAKLDNFFATQLLNSNWHLRKLDDISGGSTRQRISRGNLGSVRLLLPPLPEQRRIAVILNSADEAIEETEALISKLKQAKSGLMHDLLTRGIDEHGHLRDPEANPEQFKDSSLGWIPEEWEVAPLREVCRRITDGYHQSVKTTASGVPFLYVSCVRDGRILWEQASKISPDTYSKISKGREPEAGLILYTAVGSYGYAAIVPDDRIFSFQRHIAYILPDFTKVNPEFLVTWLNSSWCGRHADRVALGNAQKTVTLGELAQFPLPLPPSEEQQRIVKLLDAHNERIRAEEAYRDKLVLQKRGLMDDLLTGRVRVGGGGEGSVA